MALAVFEMTIWQDDLSIHFLSGFRTITLVFALRKGHIHGSGHLVLVSDAYLAVLDSMCTITLSVLADKYVAWPFDNVGDYPLRQTVYDSGIRK
jgi:hypothetical protein